jgi:hypothetical protein
MPTIKTEKPQSDRIIECCSLIKQLEDVGVPKDNTSLTVLKQRMAVYWRDGKPAEDTLPLVGSDRTIYYKFPKWSHQYVEVTLRKRKCSAEPVYPADLIAELNKGEKKLTTPDTPPTS